MEGERNRELEELKELEEANQKIRDRVDNMARQYNRYIFSLLPKDTQIKYPLLTAVSFKYKLIILRIISF